MADQRIKNGNSCPINFHQRPKISDKGEAPVFPFLRARTSGQEIERKRNLKERISDEDVVSLNGDMGNEDELTV
jgi:hypothetical protein